ncbi:hypothetical protein [Bradyrhizobium sp. F1.13.3]|uniref:hypothetical protein n=1 Tax=Bradyrhizobium sp. F1.13.3 TaxID=3156351 RepID=UPI003396F405
MLPLDVSALKEHTGQGRNDHFFDMARPGLARFRPDAALETMRRFADQSLSRQIVDFRTAPFFIEPHTIGLRDSVAPAFVTKAAGIATDALAGDKNNETYIASMHF